MFCQPQEETEPVDRMKYKLKTVEGPQVYPEHMSKLEKQHIPNPMPSIF